LSEAQLWNKLAAKGHDHTAIAAAVERCKREGYLDDQLFATLYVEGPRKAVGDARLVAELVKRGIDRDVAQHAVSTAPRGQSERIAAAYAKLRRAKPDLSYQCAARGLERLGFPTSLIYRVLREHAGAALADIVAGADGAASVA
jgi:SOS response regulatory protein OraA/RecX